MKRQTRNLSPSDMEPPGIVASMNLPGFSLRHLRNAVMWNFCVALVSVSLVGRELPNWLVKSSGISRYYWMLWTGQCVICGKAAQT